MPEKPIPTNEGDLELYLENLFEKMPEYQVPLSISVADMNRLNNAATNFDYLRNMANQVNDAKESFSEFKKTMIYGPEDASLTMPLFPEITLPGATEPGILPWLRGFVKRIKANPNYTTQIGENLGFIVDNPDPFNPGEIIPELKIKVMSDDQIEIKFSKQGLDALRVDWRPAGTEDWLSAGVFTSSPAIYQHNSPGKNPQAIELRGRLLQKNNPVSQYSPIYQVVTNP